MAAIGFRTTTGSSATVTRRAYPLSGMWRRDGGRTVLEVHTPDPWLGRYGPVVPLCQAFVDLFNTPGWPAARFIESLIGELAHAA